MKVFEWLKLTPRVSPKSSTEGLEKLRERSCFVDVELSLSSLTVEISEESLLLFSLFRFGSERTASTNFKDSSPKPSSPDLLETMEASDSSKGVNLKAESEMGF